MGTKIDEAIASLSSRAAQAAATDSVVDEAFLRSLATLVRSPHPQASYRDYLPEFIQHLELLRGRSDEQYHGVLRLLLLYLLRQLIGKMLAEPGNQYVRRFAVRNFDRIVSQAEQSDPSLYDINRDQYCKDLAFVANRVLAIGCYYVEWNGGIPRSVLYRNGLGQAGAFIQFLSRARHLRGYLSPHMNRDDLTLFTEEGSRAFYYVCAEVLKERPDIHGLVRISWLMDPALEQVGKNLVYLAALPLRHGAKRFKYKDDKEGTSGALAFSPLRRKFFNEGRYSPASYVLVWPRRELLAWYSRQATPPGLDEDLIQWTA